MENLDIWKNLPEKVKNKFETKATLLTFKRGQRIYVNGEKPKGMYFIKSGLVGLLLTEASTGKEHLLRFFKEGQFFGHRSLLADELFHGDAVVLQETTLLLLDHRHISDLLKTEPAFIYLIAQVLAKELRRCELNQLRIFEHQLLSKVARSLIYLKEIKPDHNWTRQEIAHFCVSTTANVIKALANLEKLKYISQTGRKIDIINVKALINM